MYLIWQAFMKDSPFVVDKLMISVATVYNVLQKLKRPETTFTYVTKKYIYLFQEKRYLIDYLYKIPLEKRLNVKYVTFDLWHTYQTAAKLMFIKLLIFDHKTNNALTENHNTVIKLIKHSSNGYICWTRF